MSKFTCANQRFGAVAIQHLDKLYNTNKIVYNKLLEQCRGLLWSTTMTAFILLSLQFLINHPDTHDVFIKFSHPATLHVVALNKAHIHVQHRTLFRSKIRALQVLFFAKIFGNKELMMRPWLIVLMAMMPTSYPAPLCNLLTINSFSGNLIVRGTENNFKQREIEMRSSICSVKGQYVLRG